MVFGCIFKFFFTCTGVGAANSKYACVWCKYPSEDRHNITMKWSVNDVTKGARTIGEIKLLSALPKSRSTDEKYGCKNEPLFPFIPIDHTIPDILPLFLRLSDVLINLLILGLRTHDAVKKYKNSESRF